MENSEIREKKFEFRKSYSIEHGEEFRRASLIDDAKFETAANAEFTKQQIKNNLTRHFSEADNDDIENGRDLCIENYVTKRFCLIFTIKGKIGALSKTIRIFEASKARILHIESRNVHDSGKLSDELEFFVDCEASNRQLNEIIKLMQESDLTNDVRQVGEEYCQSERDVWFPRHISQLDECTHLVTKFQPELDSEHPGFCDQEYRKRRHAIANIAFNYRQKLVYTKLKNLHANHAHKNYIKVLKILEDQGLYSPEFIPQLEDISSFMKGLTGFTLRPVAGLLSARDFLASLAFRVFQCTQYIRHPSRPEYSPEPDAVHELLGHVPMLCDANFAQFSQELGLLSLGVSDEQVERLATLYWFTVEFGLCRQENEVRAIGAGLLSAFGELNYALSGEPELRPFKPEVTALQEYQDQTFQPIYFLATSLESMINDLRIYALKIDRPFGINYDPYSQTVHVLNNRRAIQVTIKNLEVQMSQLQTLYDKIY